MKWYIIGITVLFGLGIAAWWIYTHARSALPLVQPPIDITERVEEGRLPFLLPDGFSAHLFASNLPGVRVVARDPQGTLVASLSGEGKVVALPDENFDGVSDRQVPILEELRRPHGILFFEDALYVAETHRVVRYAYDPKTFSATNPEPILSLPRDGYNQHWSRTLHRISTPEGERMLVSIGSSCNVCIETEPWRATILTTRFDGTDTRVLARGLRNSVFMETHPVTGEVWATEMGRDLLGDDTPPDEVNIIVPEGNYGWPSCYGKNIHDTNFDQNTYIRAPCTEPYETPAHINIPAHSAPLGIGFIPEEGWPEDMWFDAMVAYHGSWNRSSPAGYKIVRMQLSPAGVYEGVEDFMTGFIDSAGAVIGRPVDVHIEPGGVMFVSDDRAGAVYRVTYMHTP
jgi:glucose/arabinose dehydrogenase